MFKYILVTVLAAISYFVFYYDGVVTNELIGQFFVSGILGCLAIFMIFKNIIII